MCRSIMLATAWVTIVDGGKQRRTPAWAKWLGRIEMGLIYFSEIVLAQVEFNTGDAVNYSFAINNRVTIVKYFLALQQYVIYFVICLVYGGKIRSMLKGGGNSKEKAESAELKKIKRFMNTLLFLYSFSILWRLTSISTASCVYTEEICKVNNPNIPPCDQLMQWWIIMVYWACAYGVLYANQPGKKKYTTRLLNAVGSTFRSGASTSKSRSSTGTSKGKGRRSSGSGNTSGSWGSSGASGESDASEMSEMSTSSVSTSSAASEVSEVEGLDNDTSSPAGNKVAPA